MPKMVWLAGLLALAACNTPFNNSLPPGSLAGDWSGSLSTAGTSLGTLRLSMVPRSAQGPQTGTGLSQWTVDGAWSVSLASAADSGTLSGTGYDGSNSVTFTLQSAGGCSVGLDGLLFGGSSIMGHYTALSCALPDTGSFVVNKQ